MIFNGSNQGTFASGSVQDRLNQERCCALAIRAGDAGTGQALRRTFVEICAQSRQCASSMWHLRPGNSVARFFAGRVGDDRNRALGDRFVDEVVSIARFTAHCYKGISGLHPARVVLNPADAWIATLGEDFSALTEMLARHQMELYGMVTFGLVDRAAMNRKGC